MLHSINKPAHKKNVVMACSPLPLYVRPYIDQMNINQNFKNQIWAAQTGNNSRRELELEIENREFNIKMIFGDAFMAAVSDTITEKADTLINYVLQKGTLSERIITSPLIIKKERFTDAADNLSVINSLSFSNEQVLDFIDLQQLQIQIAQVPDSLRNNVISQSENLITSIAGDTSHFCQADAITLLENLYDTIFPSSIYFGDFVDERKEIYREEPEINESQCVLKLNPNPAKSNVIVEFSENTDVPEFTDITTTYHAHTPHTSFRATTRNLPCSYVHLYLHRELCGERSRIKSGMTGVGKGAQIKAITQIKI